MNKSIPAMVHVFRSMFYESAVVSATKVRNSMLGLKVISNNSSKTIALLYLYKNVSI